MKKYKLIKDLGVSDDQIYDFDENIENHYRVISSEEYFSTKYQIVDRFTDSEKYEEWINKLDPYIEEISIPIPEGNYLICKIEIDFKCLEDRLYPICVCTSEGAETFLSGHDNDLYDLYLIKKDGSLEHQEKLSAFYSV